MSREPDILSIPEAARCVGVSENTLRERLRHDSALREAVVIPPLGGRMRISLPRLCRYVHGAEMDAVIDGWRSKVGALREKAA